MCRDLKAKDSCHLETHFVERELTKGRWACFCVLAEWAVGAEAAITAFPCLETGGVAGSRLDDADAGAAVSRIRNMEGSGGSWTTFSRKRTARQFAVKCAVERLVEQGVLAMEGEDIVFARGNGT